jgi:hypothetical protein
MYGGELGRLEHALNGFEGFERISRCCLFVFGDRPLIELILLICADFS